MHGRGTRTKTKTILASSRAITSKPSRNSSMLNRNSSGKIRTVSKGMPSNSNDRTRTSTPNSNSRTGAGSKSNGRTRTISNSNDRGRTVSNSMPNNSGKTRTVSKGVPNNSSRGKTKAVNGSMLNNSEATINHGAPKSSNVSSVARGRSIAHSAGIRTTALGNSAVATTVTAFLTTVTADTLGPDHGFRINGLPFMVVGGYPRFQYEGYWISAVDPWPEYWGNDWYDNDDVYVTYVDNGYYLYNRRYPRSGVAISISL